MRTQLRLPRCRPWWPAALALSLLLSTGVGRGADEAARVASATAPPGVTGFTAPAHVVTIAAVTTGRIAELPVAEGAAVRSGEPVVRLDAAVQQRRVEIAAGLAGSTLEIEAAQVRREQAEAEWQRLQHIAEVSASTQKERSDAAADLRAAEVAVAQAQFRRAQAVRELALQQALLDQLEVRAPFSGFVAERVREVGDTVEDREAILKLVQLDPLLVVVDCPLALAGRVQLGQRAVLSPVETRDAPRTGEVIFVSPVADAASQTVRVKLHVPNQDAGWHGGMRVNVSLEAEPSQARAAAPVPSKEQL